MSKFGLGRGLADLQQDLATLPNVSILNGAERVVVKQIPLAQIGANPDQPRKTFTNAELAELADSIREKGVLQPILLRSVKNKPYMYEIIAGERRWRASKMAGLSEIPALVKTMTDENAMEVALIENVQRENLNPIEEGAAYKNLMTHCGYEISDVSRLIGKSESYIRNMLRLDKLPDSVKKMVETGQISASHARTIAVAENPTELAAEIVSKKLSVADTEKRVKARARARTSKAFTDNSIDIATIKKMEKAITLSLGAPAKINQRRGGAGQIVITFSTRGQMQDIIAKISR